jgi:hypothetical protein
MQSAHCESNRFQIADDGAEIAAGRRIVSP